ncbi:MAG: hypothetical protein AAF637_15775 [Pseudomonadota bacterium]
MATRWSTTRLLVMACAGLALLPASFAEPAAAREDQCVRGDGQIRRVELAVQDPERGVPCEVVYWKDTEQPGVRRVLWSARTDAGFCRQKADELVAKLAAVGWTCTTTEGATAAREEAQPATIARAEPPDPAPDQATPPVAAEPPAGQQAAIPAPATSATPDSSPDTGPDTSSAAPASSATASTGPQIREALAPQPSTALPSATRPGPAGGALSAIIEQNLTRLNDGVDGSFDAEIADYGDLDGDGQQDGLVLFTYESRRLGRARFVAAYLFDGRSYALAATKPLAGSEQKVQGAEVESIDEGVISLRLNVLEPGDATCCPSGILRQALMLRNGQLIEVNTASSESRS